MADFEYVQWTDGTPILSDYLFKMSENDQHLKDLVDAMPQGVLGWAEDSDEDTTTSTNASLITGMSVPVTVGENRLIRITYRQKSMKNSADMTTLIGIFLNGAQLTSAIFTGKKEQNIGPQEVWYVHSPAAGDHTYKVKGRIMNGGGGGNTARFRATAVSPRQLIVEDLGEYVAPV